MRDNIPTRIFIIVFTILGVFSIGLGLSFFSNSLSIVTSINELSARGNFSVVFSSSKQQDSLIYTSDIIPDRNVEGFTANPGIINNIGDPTLKNISINFTEPGQAVSYTLYASNLGDTTAYLKSIVFSNYENSSNLKSCSPLENTNPDLVNLACKDINITLEVGSSGEQNGSITSIKNHPLEAKKSEKVNIIITYKLNGTRTDGPFIVNFGDISLQYSPID